LDIKYREWRYFRSVALGNYHLCYQFSALSNKVKICPRKKLKPHVVNPYPSIEKCQMSDSKGKLCVLIPAYNCAKYLPDLIAKILLEGNDDEIIVVDDASEDDTLAIVSKIPRVHVSRNETQLGYGGTSKRLYEIALERDAEYAINIHGDFGHPPESVMILSDKIRNSKIDIVIGSRYVYLRELAARDGLWTLLEAKSRNDMPISRIIGHSGITMIQNLLYGTNLHSFHEGCRAVNRKFMTWSLEQTLPDWYDFDTFLIVKSHRAGWKISEIGIPPNYIPEVKSGVPLIGYSCKILWAALKYNRFTND
jgi:glycosyltransferase involved in cell wall biosynthesis